jgi:mannose-6-phosphate isomerase
MEQDKNKVFRLQGKVQHYAWGGFSFLPRLLNIPDPEKKPFAEYWMGAHDNASSLIILNNNQSIKLNEYIQSFKQDTLGKQVAAQFGRLPYLLKILDVKDMLSIQVHPSKENAEYGFEEENSRGVAPDAAHRNYKDDNHKPELMLALSEFWLLHGFKPRAQLLQTLERVAGLQFLLPVFEKGSYRGLYKTVMEMEQFEVNKILQPLLDIIIPAYKEGKLEKDDENFWAARAALTFNGDGRIDRGIFSIYFFNLVNLHPGQAIFQDAGLPHAYLEGQNVEIMANSDNVLRGGLTPKHIDVDELMKHVQFEETNPRIIEGKNKAAPIAVFETPAPDFELSKIELKKDEAFTLHVHSTEIFIVLKGIVNIHENRQNEFPRGTGESFVGFDNAVLELQAQENAVIYRAGIPLT